MTASPAPAPSTEARQHALLKQLLDHQLALKALFEQQPEAGKVLDDLLRTNLQTAFHGHPLPIDLDAVHCEEMLKINTRPGTATFVPADTPSRPLSALFTDSPWGGEHLDAPNRQYRFFAKSSYDEPDPAAPSKVRKVNRTTGSTPAFEVFIDQLIRQADQCFQTQLERFWQAPFAPDQPTTRRQWLAGHLAKVLQAEAALRVTDGTLEASSQALVDHFVRQRSSPSRANLPEQQRPCALAVSLKGRNNRPDIPLVGAFLLASKTLTGEVSAASDLGAVALSTPHRGIDAFSSLKALDQALMNMAAGKTSDSLLENIRWQDQPRARRYLKKNPVFSYTPIQTQLFEHHIDALLALQKNDIQHGWRLLSRYSADGKRVHELFNRLANIGAFLDIRDAMTERARRYLESALPAWYRQANHETRHTLEQLADAELSANKRLAEQFRKAAIPTLKAFARQKLMQQLQVDYPKQTIDPDHVAVQITTSLNPASLGGGIGPDQVASSDDPRSRPAKTLNLSLTELALQNTPPWDFSLYKLFTGETTTISASGPSMQFDDAYLRALVEKLDVSKGYDELLDNRLLQQGSLLRQAWGDAYRASLKTQAFAARLDDQCFLKDRNQRGYQWVKAILEADLPANRKTVDGHKIVASALLIANSPATANGYPLNDALVISVEKPQAVPNVVLFTPASPTGLDIKEFADQTALQRFLQQQWQSSSEWKTYVLQQLSEPGKAWITSPQSLIHNPFDNIRLLPITTPLYEALYAQRIATLRANADHASTSNAEVEYQSLWNKINFGIDLAMDLLSFLPITRAFNATRNITRTFLLLKRAGKSKAAARALWSISGARGRPFIPAKFGTMPTLRTTKTLSGLEVAVDPLTLNHLKGNLYQSKTSIQQYALINNQYYLTDVAQGRRFIYPQDVARRTLRFPLTLDENLQHWQVEPLPRLRGGMDPLEKGPLQTTYRDYELPPTDVAALPVLNRMPSGAMGLGFLNPLYTTNAPAVVALHIFAIQSRLRRHARNFLRTYISPPRLFSLPPRGAKPTQLFQHLFTQRDSLIFGERHTVSLTRQFLIKNMAELKKAGVKTFGFELLNTDLHQAWLDIYNTSPTHPMPAVVRERLEMGDRWAFQADEFSYTRLVEDAHAQGIKIMALDTTASSVYAPGDLSPFRGMPTLSDQLDRVTMFNFFAYKKLTEDHLTLGPHRWVALVGQGHCNTVQNIPGLAELTNSIGIRLERRIATHPLARFHRDPGVLIGSPTGSHAFVHQCDMLMCLPSEENLHLIAERVHSPQMFTTTSINHESVLRYMDNQQQMKTVRVLADGTLAYVSHAPFGALSERRFADLDALTEALIDELGMMEV